MKKSPETRSSALQGQAFLFVRPRQGWRAAGPAAGLALSGLLSKIDVNKSHGRHRRLRSNDIWRNHAAVRDRSQPDGSVRPWQPLKTWEASASCSSRLKTCFVETRELIRSAGTHAVQQMRVKRARWRPQRMVQERNESDPPVQSVAPRLVRSKGAVFALLHRSSVRQRPKQAPQEGSWDESCLRQLGE